MGTLVEALLEAIRLIGSLDSDVVQYASRSLGIALVATVIASICGIPLGVWLAEVSFPGKRGVVTVLNTLLSVPTVVVGLLVYAFISRHGPLGSMGLLFTVPGIVAGEVVLILPLVTAFTLAAVARVDRDVRRTALSLGASGTQALAAVVRESRFGIIAAVIAAFGRVVGEVGVATILGGNADAFTRTITTAIVLEVNMGRFEMALALGLVLLSLSFGINVVLQLVQGEGRSA